MSRDDTTDGSIRPAMPDPGRPSDAAASTLGAIRREFDRVAGEAETPDADGTAAELAEEPAFDIAQLLSVPSGEFLRLAYRRVLGRLPDESGHRHLSAALATGTKTRVEVLHGLRTSEEGLRKNRPVPGLRRRVAFQRLYRLPVLGRLLRIPGSLLAIPGLIRGLLAVEDRLAAQAASVARLESHAALVDERHLLVGDRVERAAVESAGLRARIDRLAEQHAREPWVEPILALAAKLDRLEEAWRERADRVDRTGRDLTMIASVGRALDLARREAGWDEEGDALATRFVGTLAECRAELVALRAQIERQARELNAQRQRGSMTLNELRLLADERRAPLSGGRLEAEAASELDELYVQFEDVFRGTRDDIKQRQHAYLDIIRGSGAGAADRPVLDVGSGRGELLELLGENGLRARGVDLNATMVRLCRERGLDCIHADAIAHLGSLEPGSLGAVTGFHIVEHLPFPVLVALLDQSLRALANGGMILFETPNPANLMVSSRWFYLDPTHRNPLPGEMLSMIAEARGFVDVTIRETNPSPIRFPAKDNLLGDHLDRLFHGPMDYALIARKP